MSTILGMIGGKLLGILATAFSGLLALISSYLKGASDQRKKQYTKNLEEYKRVREDLDEIRTNLSDNDRTERMRSNGLIRKG